MSKRIIYDCDRCRKREIPVSDAQLSIGNIIGRQDYLDLCRDCQSVLFRLAAQYTTAAGVGLIHGEIENFIAEKSKRQTSG